MDRDRFVGEGRTRWAALQAMVDAPPPRTGRGWTELSAAYRVVCADLSRARSLDLSADVQAYLDGLASRAHHRLYSVRPRPTANALRIVLEEVPRQVRAAWVYLALASVLFYGPFLFGGVGAWQSEAFATEVVPPAMLAQLEQVWLDRPTDRSTGDNAVMAGFYVYNNVGIAFRCFATGILGGLGSVFFMVYNGLVIGVTVGHVARVGGGVNILEWIVGHGPWELTGIVLSGAAGLRMGWALVATGGRTRLGSLVAAGPELFRLVLGATLLLLVAAAIEGFWSPLPLPVPVKLVFGAVQAVIVAAWLGLGGGRRA